MTNNSGLKQKKILLVEDVELNQFLARHIMESWGCVVVIAENGLKAVEKAGADDFDLVLMDIQMPEMDGMEATRKIRQMDNPQKASVPIVALTANALKSECEIYLQIGMNDYLAKPFEEKSLFTTVSKNIRKEKAMNTSPELTEVKKTDSTGVKEPLYNLSMVESISGGDRSFIARMMNLFLETVPATLSDLKKTADSGDWKALGKHAHKLKSTIDSMGIQSLKQDIRMIEAGGKTGDNPEQLRQLTGKVLRVMEEVMRQVRSEWA